MKALIATLLTIIMIQFGVLIKNHNTIENYETEQGYLKIDNSVKSDSLFRLKFERDVYKNIIDSLRTSKQEVEEEKITNKPFKQLIVIGDTTNCTKYNGSLRFRGTYYIFSMIIDGEPSEHTFDCGNDFILIHLKINVYVDSAKNVVGFTYINENSHSKNGSSTYNERLTYLSKGIIKLN